MRLAPLLVLAVIAIAVAACSSQPQASGTVKTDATGAAIENTFDQGFPADDTTVMSDSFDSDLANLSTP